MFMYIQMIMSRQTIITCTLKYCVVYFLFSCINENALYDENSAKLDKVNYNHASVVNAKLSSNVKSTK